MDTTYQSALDAAHRLDLHGKLQLLETLYVEVQKDERFSAQLAEAERRLADYRAGKSVTYSAEEALRQARSRLKR